MVVERPGPKFCDQCGTQVKGNKGEAWQAGGPDTPACKFDKLKKLVAGDPALAFLQPHVQDKELDPVDGLSEEEKGMGAYEKVWAQATPTTKDLTKAEGKARRIGCKLRAAEDKVKHLQNQAEEAEQELQQI